MSERLAPEERELRTLLERAVPQLPAPAQRLESVRERVRRRRRRRAAGLSVATLLAVAAAGLLVPSLGDPDGPSRATGISLAPPASDGSPSGGTASGLGPTSGTPTPLPDPSTHFALLDGLRLRVPADWSVLQAPGSPTVYVSTQRLGLPPDKCANPLDGFCTPLVRTLDADSVLVQLRLTKGLLTTGSPGNKESTDKLVEEGDTGVAPEGLLSACAAVGGTQQLGAPIIDGSGAGVLVVATACLSHPSPEREAQVRQLLTSASFD